MGRVPRLALPPIDHAHLWLAEPTATDGAGEDWLGAEERARAAAFRFDRDRRLYMFAHALLRGVLARYLATRPGALRFTTAPGGRPELRWDGGPPPLRFSLTHTAGLAACMVTAAQDCGVDAERIDPSRNCAGLAAAALAAHEVNAWRAQPEDRRSAFFLERWTLKEACLKGLGLGLARPLSEVAFQDGNGEPRCILGPSVGDDGRAWRFWKLRPTPRHVAAAALRTGGPPGGLAVFWVLPTRPPIAR